MTDSFLTFLVEYAIAASVILVIAVAGAPYASYFRRVLSAFGSLVALGAFIGVLLLTGEGVEAISLRPDYSLETWVFGFAAFSLLAFHATVFIRRH